MCVVMVIGVLQFELLIPGAGSLKEKRAVVRSVKDRLHREHQVSVAEVARQDNVQIAVLAVAVAGSDGARIGQILDRISNKLRSLRNAELGETFREIISPMQDDSPTGPADTGMDGLAAEMLANSREERPA
jgi:uncharacterized protein YlxP (DUF503 family)